MDSYDLVIIGAGPAGLAVTKECKAQGVSLQFTNIAPNVREVFRLTGLFCNQDPEAEC